MHLPNSQRLAMIVIRKDKSSSFGHGPEWASNDLCIEMHSSALEKPEWFRANRKLSDLLTFSKSDGSNSSESSIVSLPVKIGGFQGPSRNVAEKDLPGHPPCTKKVCGMGFTEAGDPAPYWMVIGVSSSVLTDSRWYGFCELAVDATDCKGNGTLGQEATNQKTLPKSRNAKELQRAKGRQLNSLRAKVLLNKYGSPFASRIWRSNISPLWRGILLGAITLSHIGLQPVLQTALI
ncbi:hypothetical protein M9H77_30209 [Catharanthus roseus]|uniref:Uncharacterized protein n=1 Tax=Catharanthus roseus TaxID=4058 RepID=A0ACB9ZWM5_CATRO|nr:hypothetical protein M9H77_30209 [Catharanthus roseus]